MRSLPCRGRYSVLQQSGSGSGPLLFHQIIEIIRLDIFVGNLNILQHLFAKLYKHKILCQHLYILFLAYTKAGQLPFPHLTCFPVVFLVGFSSSPCFFKNSAYCFIWASNPPLPFLYTHHLHQNLILLPCFSPTAVQQAVPVYPFSFLL